MLDCLCDRLAAITYIELLIYVFEMILDRVGGDEKLVPDFLILHTLSQQFQDIEFAIGQTVVFTFKCCNGSNW